MDSVYLETSFVSYLVAPPSRDLLVAAHQQATRDWWDDRRSVFDCYISQVVIDEISQRDASEVVKRTNIVANLDVLEVTEEAETLTRAIPASGVIPARAVRDAAHIAVATVNEIDYLLTWNCKHLANAQIMRKISGGCRRLGRELPLICTPEELMGA